MSNQKITLLILAAGLGSRYGGLKQMESIGPSGEILLDYSCYDAIKAGFDKIVCVIREDMEQVFYDRVTKRWQNKVEFCHSYQDIRQLPSGFEKPANREKPWGTGHAILAARQQIATPFAMINADDFYGRSSFVQLANYLKKVDTHSNDYSMVAFVLKNTMSTHGHVSRGVCNVDNKNMLKEVHERKKIAWHNNNIAYTEDDKIWHTLTPDTLVSMNFWGFTPSIFPLLEQGFQNFLRSHINSAKEEFLIPSAVDSFIRNKQATVKVLRSDEKWMGITYKEDKDEVKSGLAEMIRRGIYPSSLGNI